MVGRTGCVCPHRRPGPQTAACQVCVCGPRTEMLVHTCCLIPLWLSSCMDSLAPPVPDQNKACAQACGCRGWELFQGQKVTSRWSFRQPPANKREREREHALAEVHTFIKRAALRWSRSDAAMCCLNAHDAALIPDHVCHRRRTQPSVARLSAAQRHTPRPNTTVACPTRHSVHHQVRRAEVRDLTVTPSPLSDSLQGMPVACSSRTTLLLTLDITQGLQLSAARVVGTEQRQLRAGAHPFLIPKERGSWHMRGDALLLPQDAQVADNGLAVLPAQDIHLLCYDLVCCAQTHIYTPNHAQVPEITQHSLIASRQLDSCPSILF